MMAHGVAKQREMPAHAGYSHKEIFLSLLVFPRSREAPAMLALLWIPDRFACAKRRE
jgi:hypothetical protein